MTLSLKLPGLDFSKAKYEFDYDPSLILSFAEEVMKNSNSFNIDIRKTSSDEILKKLNIFGTNTAGILFGEFKYRVAHFGDKGDILDQKTYKGLYRVLSDEFIETLQSRSRKNGNIISEKSLATREEVTYSKEVLREVFANAIAHALYQKNQGEIIIETHPNRITVRNNCKLELETFAKKWFSRTHYSTNRHLMEALRLARITDELGTGKMRVFCLMIEMGKKPPVISFDRLQDYGVWSTTIYNEENSKDITALADDIKVEFPSADQWQLAISLLIWGDRKWSEIETFLDDYYRDMALEVLNNTHCPVLRTGNKLRVKDWAKEKLEGFPGEVDREVDSLTENQSKIISLIKQNPRISKREMEKSLKIRASSVDKNLETLKKRGLIERVGSPRGGYWKLP